MLGEIEHAAAAAQETTLYEGTIVRDATDEDVGLMVRVKGFGGTRGRDAFGPLPWMPRYQVGSTPTAIQYPQKGDIAWVAFDDEGEGVVLAYADPDWF